MKTSATMEYIINYVFFSNSKRRKNPFQKATVSDVIFQKISDVIFWKMSYVILKKILEENFQNMHGEIFILNHLMVPDNSSQYCQLIIIIIGPGIIKVTKIIFNVGIESY